MKEELLTAEPEHLNTETVAVVEKPKKFDTPEKNGNSTIVTFFVIFAAYFVFSIFFFNIVLTPLNVFGFSMAPTLNEKAEGVKGTLNTDMVYIKISKDASINDIIVFDATDVGYPDDYFIKRIIAVAGDTLQFKAKSEPTEDNYILRFEILRNGEIIDETSYASETLLDVGNHDRNPYDRSEFYKNLINESVLVVPENSIFVMGDNRSRSTDSRNFGFVSVDSIIGKVKIHVKNDSNLVFAIIHSIKQHYLFG